MIITKIERQKRHPDRVNLYLDGEFALGVNREVVVKLGLRKGDELSRDRLNELTSLEEFTLAKQKALRLLGHRLRSEKELRIKLREKEFNPDIIDSVVKHLQSVHLLNDLEFARAYVHDTQLRKPAGRRLLEQQLRVKGIPPPLIQQVLDQSISPQQEEKDAFETAGKLFRRYRSSRKKIENEKQQKRIAESLSRRGYRWQTISCVMKKLFNDQPFNISED